MLLAKEGQEKPPEHKHGACWEQRQHFRGPAWGSALSCSQHTATSSATAMEIKARKAQAFHHTTALVCSFFLGGRKGNNNMKPKGKEPRLPTSSIPGNSQPLLSSARQWSFLSASGMQADYSMLCKSHRPIYCLTCSESHYRAMRMHIKRTERKDENQESVHSPSS